MRFGMASTGVKSVTCVFLRSSIFRSVRLDSGPMSVILVPSRSSDCRPVRPDSGPRSLTCEFQSLSDCPASLYNEQDSSMEASEGLNPASSQGYLEVQSVEARALAKAGQIKTR